jgi:alanine racemase
MAFNRSTYAEIDREAFRHNLRIIRSVVGPGVKIMAVIKADAYGHGALALAPAALEAGADVLGVAVLEEGMELRASGITAPILILTGLFPDEIEDFLKHDLATTLSRPEFARELSRQAGQAGKTARVHLKIDTGMGRLGLQPDGFYLLASQIASDPHLRLEGISTQFSSADEADAEFTRQQLACFHRVLGDLKARGIRVPLVHAANSAATLKFPEAHFDMVRPGIILYGALPSPGVGPLAGTLSHAGKGFLPVMHWKTRVLQVSSMPAGAALSYGRRFVTERESRIAALPIGYADGLHRGLSNKMSVLVRGQRARQVGRICMDLTLIDVTDIPGVEEGDEVVLFGRQGDALLPVDEMAAHADTLGYEILCHVGKRVPRVIKG